MIQGAGNRVQGSGFRAQGSGFRAQPEPATFNVDTQLRYVVVNYLHK
jgi:hypothetical protein